MRYPALMSAETQSQKYKGEKMRYRVEVDLGSSVFEIDAQNPDDAIKEAISLLEYMGLSELLARAEVSVEPVQKPRQDRADE